jgi:enterochelin esterase-like enzyme
MKPLTRFACLAALLTLTSAWRSASAADAPTKKDAAKESLADGDFKIGPPYAKAPELTVKDDVPKGKVHEFTMSSQDSKIYPGLKGGYTRKVAVYIPHGYVAGTAAPFMVIQDAMTQGSLPKILDNMIHEHRLPPMIAVFIKSGGGDGKGSERGLEYDTVSGTYTDFIETEVLPRIEKDYNVKFTKDPEGRATMGGSSGAACAFTMAWFHPERYRRVISYSGTYVNQQSPPDRASPRGAWEYHATLIPGAERKPLRIWLEVGEKDLHPDDPEETWHNWPLANHRMATALAAKGYPYRFTFSRDGRHADPRVLEQTLPAALEWAWRDYQG